MKYVVWANLPWKEFAFKKMVSQLPDRDELIFVGKDSEHEREEQGIRFVKADLRGMESPCEYVAIVCSPYWICQALGGGYRKIAFIMEPCPSGEDCRIWNKYSGLLAEAADLVITISEKTYLEQCLKRRNVLWWDEGQIETQGNRELLRSFLEYMDQGKPLEDLMKMQWEQQMQAYTRIRSKLGPHETVSYLLASYLYFLGRAEAAEALRESFELALLKEHPGTLHSHYRFFSAIETRQGDLEQALHTYAITAVLPREKETLMRMEKWAVQERVKLLEAELYRENEDFRSAEEAASEDGSEEAEQFLFDLYLEQWMWTKAAKIMDRHRVHLAAGISGEPIRATLLWIHGRKHEAVSKLLRASLLDWNALITFSETDLLEQASRRLGG
ncbi:hypothetical protein ACM1RC_03630 [Paenibacillus azoreducens]|uniref:hypothetical protein n=1 Tax=Paenibacillus azoreducens TaxID=116718 RepID=UPI0039F5BD97